jgi:hypothetical protein
MFMLQNDFEYSASQFRPEPLGSDKSLIYKTDLDRATADIKAQNAVRTLANGFTKYFQDVVTVALKRLYSVPRSRADIRRETGASKN